MMDTILSALHYISQVLFFVNPVLMVIASIAWIILYLRTSRDQSRFLMRAYCLERQIDLILTHYAIDRRDIEIIETLRKRYE
jgi:hypothetical protein